MMCDWAAEHKTGILFAVTLSAFLLVLIPVLILGLALAWALALAAAVAWGCRQHVDNKISGLKNFLVMLTTPDGDPVPEYIRRTGDEQVWFTTYDKQNHILGIHPLTVKNGAGLGAADFGTEKVHLFFWDGNTGKDPPHRFLLPPKRNRTWGVPEGADSIMDVKFGGKK